MTVFCGIDWSEDHHQVAVVDTSGHLVAKQRITDDAAGLSQLLGMLAEAGDHTQGPIPVAIQTARGCWWPACAPPAGRLCDQPDGRMPLPAAACGLGQEDATTPTRSCSPTSCAPTWRPTGRCRPTPNWSVRSPCWPAPPRTRSGTAPGPTTSCARCCASSSPGFLAALVTCAVGSCGQRPAPYWQPPRRRRRRPG
jgi:Transposase